MGHAPQLDPCGIGGGAMSGFDIKGWCPGALRPMASGDGLVLRIRAPNGRLTPDQARSIAGLSRHHGNGLIDLTSRANLQLRGVDAAGHLASLDALAELGLLDPDAGAESRRNVILSPFAPVDSPAWQAAAAIARAMTSGDAPQLPGKFGFAVDTSPWVLGAVPCDIRLRPVDAGWQVVPDGGDWGLTAPDPASAAASAIALARWFAQGGIDDGRGRMRDYLRRQPDLPQGAAPMAAPNPADAPGPGPAPNGWMLGFAFGQITPAQLEACADAGALRLTPWRALLIEGADALPPIPGAIPDPENPLLRIHACTGAPACSQALADVRALARQLAPRLGPRTLHISGCAKGCAHRGRADLTLIATAPDRFDLIRDGSVRGRPTRRDIGKDALAQLLSCPHNTATATGKASPMHAYETDGARISAQSFATIRAEADLGRFNPDEEPVVVRMIHAAGLVGLERDVAFSPGMAATARAALQAGAPILCDARMVSEGITRARLPAANRILCTLNAPGVPELAAGMGTTRSAAALELWRDYLAGAVVAIGNAPTALFHLLNMLRDPACPRPAAIIGCPVGFVGAAESKDALMQDLPAPALIVRGRLGGSAITVAAINALASRKE